MECDQPLWVPDSQASRCALCTKEFGLLKSRHHCRACGNVFCDGCSSNTIPLPQYGLTGPQRVCNPCFTHQTNRYQYHMAFIETITKGSVMWVRDRGNRLESHLSLSRNGKFFICRNPQLQIPIESIILCRKGLHDNSRASQFCCFGGEDVDEDKCFYITHGGGLVVSFEASSAELANYWCSAISKAPEVLIESTAPPRVRQTAGTLSAVPSTSSVSSSRTSSSTAPIVSDFSPSTRAPSEAELERAQRVQAMASKREALKKKYRLESLDS